MCGFIGYIRHKRNYERENFVINLKKMSNQITHRGPDSSGLWISEDEVVGISHRRLSILDLSNKANQPMISENERFVIAYNGEIYNHNRLRDKLKEDGFLIGWKSSSDTETLLNCINCWGLKKTLKQIKGMFAFCLWDKKKNLLTLVRDRIGEKPLYYGWTGNKGRSDFLFGSDLQAFKPHPEFKPVIDEEALSLYLRFSNVPAPLCIYKNFFKLIPGTYLEFSLKKNEIRLEKYWDLEEQLSDTSNNKFEVNDFNQASDLIERQLTDSVLAQTISDVPIGTFLSGGIDSSLITALLQSNSSKPINTFSIGFKNEAFNEAKNAKAISNFLGTNHHEEYIDPLDCIEIIPKLSKVYSEPFADASQIPTIFLCELAKQNISVSLSGDGGDELFCGYNRHSFGIKIWKTAKFFPDFLKKYISLGLSKIPPHFLNSLESSKLLRFNDLEKKINKVSILLSSNSINIMHDNLMSISHETDIYLKCKTFKKSYKKRDSLIFDNDQRKQLMYLDLVEYLPNDILVKVDRASMATSLEARAPFLDYELVEAAYSIPSEFHFYKGTSKALLKNILKNYVPEDLFQRPKKGFGVPISSWLRGPLKNWANNLLNKHRIKEEGYFDEKEIEKIWLQHLEGKKNYSEILWNILVFQMWLENE